MLVISNYSDVEKLEAGLFSFVSVSETLQPDKDNSVKVVPLVGLNPPSGLKHALVEKDIKKKEFLKKYDKHLDTDAAQIELYNVALAIQQAKKGFCFICSDDEWEMGYMEVLAKKIEDMFGVQFMDAKKAKKIIKEKLSEISKKDRKNKDKLKKFVKGLMKELKAEYMILSKSGDKLQGKLRRRYALDQILASATLHGIVYFEGDEIKINNKAMEKEMKSSAFIKAFLATYEEDKKYKKMMDKVFKEHDMKVTEKSLKKLEKASLLTLTAECVSEFQTKRYGNKE